jgi:hypothetical protein
MKNRAITYWVATSIITLVLGISGFMALIHLPSMMVALAHLGYPAYFSNILGIGKIVGLIIVLIPNAPRLKEWAYAGFTITILSACYSHFSAGDGWLALEPLATFLFLMISYATRPADRRLACIQSSPSAAVDDDIS